MYEGSIAVQPQVPVYHDPNLSSAHPLRARQSEFGASSVCCSLMECSPCGATAVHLHPCDETRYACGHDRIEPLSGLNAIDFIKRVFRNGGDVEILSRASRSFGC